MNVSGEEAKLWRAVRLDSFADVNQGELVSADETSGEVVWLARGPEGSTEQKKAVLGPHAIRIVKAGR